MRSRLYTGRVGHRRSGAARYDFRYRVSYWCLDLDELELVDRTIRLFGLNRPNFASFYDRDHLGPGRPTREAVAERLDRRGVDLGPGGRVELVTSPRVLGYVFNPVSFYLCRDASGAIRHVIAEVHNTSGERYAYDLAPMAEGDGPYRSRADKVFFVSPFIGMEVRYEFAVRERDDRLSIHIRESGEEGRFFDAWLDLRARPLTNAGATRTLLDDPLMTYKTIALIHWHGLKLWLRGAPYRRNPHQLLERT